MNNLHAAQIIIFTGAENFQISKKNIEISQIIFLQKQNKHTDVCAGVGMSGYF